MLRRTDNNNSDNRPVSEKLLIVADDLTGASDTGVQFSKGNLKTVVITDTDNFRKVLKDYDVVVVDTESRFDDMQTAYLKASETGKIAKPENIKYIYKKLDSTMRGNIGAEIAGLMDSLDISHTFVVPALPLYGRTTLNGNVYVKGILLEETEFADDPKNPVRESYIPGIIAHQTDKRTGVICFDDLLAGKLQFINKLEILINEGVQIIIIDAEENEDLNLIASVLSQRKEIVMFAGCSGFAEELSKYLEFKKEKKSSIVLAGSVNKVTLSQIEFAAGQLNIKVVDIDAVKILAEEKSPEKERIMELIRESISEGNDIIIRSASSVEAVAMCFDKGKKLGLDSIKVSDTMASFLGELAKEIVDHYNIKGIVFTGGDTAIKAANKLNISGIEIRDEILHGIPYGYFTDEKYKDIMVVTKAGGFGAEDALFQILNFLRNS